MVATAVLLMTIVVAGVLLVGIALIGRFRVGATRGVRESNPDASWMPAIFSDGGSTDCSPGDAGCDGGGGGGGD